MARKITLSVNEERSLGMDQRITRRDFLNATLLGTGTMLLQARSPLQLLPQKEPWDGYGGVGDYANSHGNTKEVLRMAHEVAAGRYDQPPAEAVDTGEVFDLVVIGGGMSGLSAAYYFKKNRRPGQRCLIIENHPIFGGESKRNEFIVNGQRLIGPQGANEFDIPANPGEPGYELYGELGIPRKFEYQTLPSKFRQLEFDRTNYGFHLWVDEASNFGHFFDERSHAVKPRWVRDLWEQKLKGAPFSTKVKQDFLTWKYGEKRYYQGQDFECWLDTMSYRNYLEKIMALSPEVTQYVDPILAAAVGLGSDAISAYAAHQVAMPGFQGFSKEVYYPHKLKEISPLTWHSFPGGNDGFARYFMKALIAPAIHGGQTFEDILNRRVNFRALDDPENDVRIRLGATAVRVKHDGPLEKAEQLWVTYVKGEKVYRLKTRGVVMASGGWITRRVVRDLPDEYRKAYQNFYHSPMLVVNVAVTNWRFLYKLGLTACRWFDGFGFTCNIRRPMIVGDYRPPLNPDRPTIVTFYVPFYYPGRAIQEQGSEGRQELLSTSYREYEVWIRQQMVRLFGEAGFDPKKDIAGLILNRWGHAYVNPQPGFFFGLQGRLVPRDIIRKRFGRIAFGHSELVGHQYWLGAIGEGRRASEQVLEIL
ncbi:FAD-dependent oxidoreductase [Acidobacteria bacterium AH-259-O06]|nr:FAD-dependent oxidoreductase [Acidobacteria bacterium AH-259-O06]